MSDLRVIVIGTSKGGLRALSEIVHGLPRELPAAVCVVQHVGAHPSVLPAIMAAKGSLPAIHPHDGAQLRPGCIYVAPPDLHMHLEGNAIRILRTAKEHHTRPAIDPLFRSAATSHGNRVIGVVLTGMLDDGTPGLQTVKACGGIAVVQDPQEA